MNESLKALDQFVSRVLILASSSKVWFTLGGMIMAVWVGYQQGGIEGMAIILSGILGLPTIYTVAKTVQNVKLTNGNSQDAAAQTPAAEPPAPTPQAVPAPPPAPQPAAAPVPPAPVEPPVPFNKEGFMAKVEELVMSLYGIRNACTLFYTAQYVRNTSGFNNTKAWQDCRDFIIYLGELAFKEVWGETYDEALINIKKPDKEGCTFPSLEYKAIQYGMAHHAILLELQRVKGLSSI